MCCFSGQISPPEAYLQAEYKLVPLPRPGEALRSIKLPWYALLTRFIRWRARRQSAKELRTQEELLKAVYQKMKESEAEQSSKQQTTNLPRYDDLQKYGQQFAHDTDFSAERAGNGR
jgi:hypothetical protein